jgi:hypothetical protein
LVNETVIIDQSMIFSNETKEIRIIKRNKTMPGLLRKKTLFQQQILPDSPNLSEEVRSEPD